jgi:hypothetical protein
LNTTLPVTVGLVSARIESALVCNTSRSSTCPSVNEPISVSESASMSTKPVTSSAAASGAGMSAMAKATNKEDSREAERMNERERGQGKASPDQP